MSSPTRASHPLYDLLPTDIEGFDLLAELALDTRSSWNHATDKVWRELGPVLWELTHNPWGLLQTVSLDRIEQVNGCAWGSRCRVIRSGCAPADRAGYPAASLPSE